jgi:methylenetetrahydrofolate dehydrogenase (NADP+) / methenyltetrahydrofolate cyclohydrolase
MVRVLLVRLPLPVVAVYVEAARSDRRRRLALAAGTTPDLGGLMAARIIDGKAHAAAIRGRVAEHVARLRNGGPTPGLAVVLVGEDPASRIYVRNKARQTEEAGMVSFERRLDAAVSERELLALVERLNRDPAVHGILVQLPLPGHIDAARVIDAIDPAKDVDGFTAINAGRLATGGRAMAPCTPLGCLALLRAQGVVLAGAEAVVVGRSNIVGKPMAQLLLGADATVTLAHSRTRDLPAVCRRADVLVAAVGRAEMVRGDWIKPGATVIDVGINRVEGEGGRSRLVGDVHFPSAAEVAGAITPVPGGVGPMTIACLLANTLTACCRIHGLAEPERLV